MSGQLCALVSGLQGNELFVIIPIQVCATLFLYRMVMTSTRILGLWMWIYNISLLVCLATLMKTGNQLTRFCSLKISVYQPAASIIIIILSDYQKLSSNLIISNILQLVVIWFDWKCSLSPDVAGSLGIMYVLGRFNAQCFHPIPRRRDNLWS